MYGNIFSSVLQALLLLLQRISTSSAYYATKRCPLLSSSWSSSFSMILLKSGLRGYLSTTVGMPSFRTFPLSSLGISTLRTGLGRYFPSLICWISCWPFSLRYGRSSSTPIPSIPPAPLLDFTLLYARFMLSLSNIFSNSLSVDEYALATLFSVILDGAHASAYPPCSAGTFCR